MSVSLLKFATQMLRAVVGDAVGARVAAGSVTVAERARSQRSVAISCDGVSSPIDGPGGPGHTVEAGVADRALRALRTRSLPAAPGGPAGPGSRGAGRGHGLALGTLRAAAARRVRPRRRVPSDPRLPSSPRVGHERPHRRVGRRDVACSPASARYAEPL